MKNLQREDYRVLATVSFDQARENIPDIICKVFLPKRTTESARLVFLPNDEQEKRLRPAYLVSVHAQLRQPNGHVNIITSNEALITSHKSTVWGPGLREHVIQAEPWDLKVETVRHEQKDSEAQRLDGCFWLSRNQLLSNVSVRSFSYTGHVGISKFDPTVLTLASGLPISFTVRSRYIHPNEDDTLMFDETVADFNVETQILTPRTIGDSLSHLEDVLRLVSFIGEYPCVCLGWSASNSSCIVDFYRSRTVSSDRPPSVHDAIVDYADFADFLPAAYKAFVETIPNAALRRALDYVVPDTADSIESSYIKLYAAVETLVLFFRRREGLEFIFGDESEWKTLNSDLRKWLKSHPILKDKKEKRPFIYEKLTELTRYSFSAAFQKFCDHYKVDLSDLWPMVGGGAEDSLSRIRNKLVHGEVYQQKHFQALMGAREHLRWSIYRMIFGVLGWPITRTKIDAAHIAQSPIHNSLDDDRRLISG